MAQQGHYATSEEIHIVCITFNIVSRTNDDECCSSLNPHSSGELRTVYIDFAK